MPLGADQRPLVVSESRTAPPFELYDAWSRGSEGFKRGGGMFNKYMAGRGVEWGRAVISMMLEHTQIRDLCVADRTRERAHRTEWMERVMMTSEGKNACMEQRIYPILAMNTRYDPSFVLAMDAGAVMVLDNTESMTVQARIRYFFQRLCSHLDEDRRNEINKRMRWVYTTIKLHLGVHSMVVICIELNLWRTFNRKADSEDEDYPPYQEEYDSDPSEFCLNPSVLHMSQGSFIPGHASQVMGSHEGPWLRGEDAEGDD